MRLLKSLKSHILIDYRLFLAGAIIAMPGIEIVGISASYLPCFFALVLIPRFVRKIPTVILALFSLGFMSFVTEIFIPTSSSFMSSRYRSATNQINTKFASSIQSENFVLWLKFSTALIGATVLVLYAYSRNSEDIILSGFLTGSLISVLIGFLTLKPGEGTFVQSIGLGRTNTTFGMICSLSIALLFVRSNSAKFNWVMVSLLMAGVLISGSRGAALTSVSALFFTSIWRKGAPTIFAAGWSLTVVVLMLIEHAIWLSSRIGVRAFTPSASVPKSDLIREQLRQQALIDWSYDPFSGVGFSVLTQGHSTYLQTLAAGGLLLFIGYLMTDLRTITSVIAAQRLKNKGCLLALAFCTIFNHFTQNQIDIPFLYFVLAITLIESRVGVRQGKGG